MTRKHLLAGATLLLLTGCGSSGTPATEPGLNDQCRTALGVMLHMPLTDLASTTDLTRYDAAKTITDQTPAMVKAYNAQPNAAARAATRTLATDAVTAAQAALDHAVEAPQLNQLSDDITAFDQACHFSTK